MNRIFLTAAAAALALSACSRSQADEFRAGVPQKEEVAINVPQKAGRDQQELKGDHSSFYDLTRGATVLVNGGTGAVLGLVKAITDYPPTTTTETQAIWGPHTEALSPNTWKLTVTKQDDNSFSYVFEGKPKTAADTAYVAILSGHHNTSVKANHGTGEFLLDWDKAATLPEHDNNVGTVTIAYGRDEASDVVTVNATFVQVKDSASGVLNNFEYRYVETPGAGGVFEFSTKKNLDSGSALEKLAIKSRWNQSGAGRADVRASSGDFVNAFAASECWDSNFASQFLTVNWDQNTRYGVEATDCAQATADYSNL